MKLRLVMLVPLLLAASATSAMTPAATASTASTVGPPMDFFAVVNSNGTLARGTPGTSVTHTKTGLYNLTFPGSVQGCAAVANLGYAGTSEVFTFASVVTVALRGRTAQVDVTYPGDTTAGFYPHEPVLKDNSFHIHVDCRHALFAVVTLNGTLRAGSPGVTTGAHVTDSGKYVVNFGQDISACAPVATVHNSFGRIAFSAQAHMALGADGRSLSVWLNRGSTSPIDWEFDVIVTCDEAPAAVFPHSAGFWNGLALPNATSCALTASWYDPTPGSNPQNQGFVSTWARTTNLATLQTKNGGYGVQLGFGADLVATC